ncbi:unnamed protein product [Phaedon cochleariae]|uniref:DUF4797 domain-containing protein n=1 Tax=Phaedon cochleariae TaxID=80249 RepID=A0A9N9SGH2_PHACE|nr:unnamed protein product [Phaedon cochleariae]
MPSTNSLVLTSIPPDSRSTSPMTMNPSPCREIRGIRLFRAISRKLSRRSEVDGSYPVDSDCRSSSADSNSDSSSSGRSSRLKKGSSSGDSGFRSVSPNQMSSSSSSSSVSGSDNQQRPRHHHSTSAESIRKVFQSLNLNVRSRSCTNTKEKRKNVKPAPKRILRQPMTYTYVKGLSGLPTQRIPRTRQMLNPCGCGMQYNMPGLNR